MNDNERIHTLLATGHITDDDAEILLAALAEHPTEEYSIPPEISAEGFPRPPVAPSSPPRNPAKPSRLSSDNINAASDDLRDTLEAELEAIETHIEAYDDELDSLVTTLEDAYNQSTMPEDEKTTHIAALSAQIVNVKEQKAEQKKHRRELKQKIKNIKRDTRRVHHEEPEYAREVKQNVQTQHKEAKKKHKIPTPKCDVDIEMDTSYFRDTFVNAVEGFVGNVVNGFAGKADTTADNANDAMDVPQGWLKLSGFCGDVTVRTNATITVPRCEGNAVLTQLESGGYLVKTPSNEGGWLKNLHKIASDILVEVPVGTSLDMHMTAGDAEISGVAHVRGRFVGGDFTAYKVGGMNIAITAGDIYINSLLQEGHHRLHATAGDVKLDFLQGSCVALDAKGICGNTHITTANPIIEYDSVPFRKSFACVIGDTKSANDAIHTEHTKDTRAHLDFTFTVGDIFITEDSKTSKDVRTTENVTSEKVEI